MGLLAFLIFRKKPDSFGRNEEEERICRSGFWRECFNDD